MKQHLVSVFATSLFISALLATGSVLAVYGPDIAMGRYPNATSKSLAVQIGHDGLLIQESTYETSDRMDQVVAWYAMRYGVGLFRETDLQDGCTRLASADAFIGLHWQVNLSICAITSGTQIVFKQTLDFNH